MAVAVAIIGTLMWLGLIKVIWIEPIGMYLGRRRLRRSLQPSEQRPISVPLGANRSMRYGFPDPTRA